MWCHMETYICNRLNVAGAMDGNNADTSNRRNWLKKVSVGSLLGIAGCMSQGGGNTSTSTTTSGEQSTESSNRAFFSHVLSFKGAVYYPVLVANEMGYYDEENVEASLSFGMDGGQAVKQLVARNMKINSNGMDPTILANSKGGNIGQIMSFLDINYALVAPPKYESFDDLPDEIQLAISSPTSGSTTIAMMMLDREGIDTENQVVQRQLGGSSDRFAAVKAGQVDLGATVMSVALKAKSDPDVNILGWAHQVVGSYPFIGLAANVDWVNENEQNYDAAVRHTTATLRGLHYGWQNEEEMKSFFVENDIVGEDIVDKYYSVAFGEELMSKTGEVKAEHLQNNFDALNMIDELDKPYPDANELLLSDVYSDAKKKLKDKYGIQ